jgi:hypothetical protein
MASTDPRQVSSHQAHDAREAARFELIFRRVPTPTELSTFRHCRDGLLLRLPRRVRRRVALLITR